MTRYTAILTIVAMLVTTGLMPPAALARPGHAGDHKNHAEHSSHKDHKGHSGHHQGATPPGEAVEVDLLDLELVDQDGRKVQFKSDVIGNRLVVINTFYTSCGLICSILTALFVNLQNKLGDGRYGGWTRFYEFPPPTLILDRLENLRAARLAKVD
jgi:cytochrome oxidase Cu insertion factor (SCO1/SenC/PrrC family)